MWHGARVALQEQDRRARAPVAHSERRLGQIDHLQFEALEHARPLSLGSCEKHPDISGCQRGSAVMRDLRFSCISPQMRLPLYGQKPSFVAARSLRSGPIN